MYDYGECHICGERMEEKHVKQDFWIKGKLIVIEGVPQACVRSVGRRSSRRMLDSRLRRF
ncbi:MAG: YgiT-type zinc finger protein [Candidatus Methylomirabilales bacterium]